MGSIDTVEKRNCIEIFGNNIINLTCRQNVTIKEKFSLSFYLRVSEDLVLTRNILKEISRISRIATFTRNKSVQISSWVISISNRIQSIRCYEMDTVYRISST